MHIGDRIRRLREAKGLSQTELADKIQMDKSQYSKLEKDKADPSFSTLEKVSLALGASLFELFNDDLLMDSSSFDKSFIEKVHLIDQLDEEDKKTLFRTLDSFYSKKKLTMFYKNVQKASHELA
jgi:transcriptional regulator with XRE-family HTH domain